MKQLSVIFSSCMLLMSCSSPREQKSISSIKTTDELQFVTKRIRDLRCLLRSEQDISDFDNRQLCSVIMIGKYNRSIVNIPIGDGMTLDKVMLLRFGKEYDGQIKVVSQDSIIQTSIKKYKPSEQITIQVHPGDLVFIDGRD